MIFEAIALGWMAYSYIYHRWIEPPAKPLVPDAKVPVTAEGSTIPLIYGRCRVRAPVLAWSSDPLTVDIHGDDDDFGDNLQIPNLVGGAAPYLYLMDLFFVLGIPFENGGASKIYNAWAGERKMTQLYTGLEDWGSAVVPIDQLIGDGNFEGGPDPWAFDHTNRIGWLTTYPGPTLLNGELSEGRIEFLNGNASQQLVAPTIPYAPSTYAGKRMSQVLASSLIAGYRGFLSVFLHGGRPVFVPGYTFQDPQFNLDFPDGIPGTTSMGKWIIGTSPEPPAYSFEVSSYPATSVEFFYDGSLATQVGFDVNPVDALYDLLTAKFAKLGIDPALVDLVTFGAAAKTLFIEGHGYSRVIEQPQDAESIIAEILQQIDAVLYEDPVDSKIKIRLIRGDYGADGLPEITPDNCEKLTGFAAGGWTGIPNKIRIVFTDRSNDYQDGSATAQNEANAVGQDGIVRETVIEMRGITTLALAVTIAARELQARSRPITKCTAVVDRSFLRTVQGDVVALTWPEYGISRMMMRVANVRRGTLANGAIELDLIQDMFYVHRGIVAPGVRGIPGFGDLSGG